MSEAPVDKRTAWKIVVSVVVVVTAVGGLLWASTSADMQFYRMVDEVNARPEYFKGKRLQVHGFVVADSIEQKQGTLEYRFKLETRLPRPHSVIEASYKGLVPDTFKSGSEVIATGMLAADNKLAVGPDGISAKCPSKYEAKEGTADKAMLNPKAPATR